MNHQTLTTAQAKEIVSLFTSVFTASAGEAEGTMLQTLSSELAANIDDRENICFGSMDDGDLVACIFFTRLHYPASDITIFMLSPVAVATAQQRKGIGQALIRFGLERLTERGIDIVLTYGDPAFYSKLAFQPLAETMLQAPQPLSMPFGWQARPLRAPSIPTIPGRPICFPAFDNPAYW